MNSDFYEVVESIVQKNPHFKAEAFDFVADAVCHTQEALGVVPGDPTGHVTGKELLEGIRDLAVSEYGSSAKRTLASWGVHSCEDIGEIVFAMVNNGLLGKTNQDNQSDFSGGYSFDSAFPDAFYQNSRFWIFIALSGALFLWLLLTQSNRDSNQQPKRPPAKSVIRPD